MTTPQLMVFGVLTSADCGNDYRVHVLTKVGCQVTQGAVKRLSRQEIGNLAASCGVSRSSIGRGSGPRGDVWDRKGGSSRGISL